MPPATIRRKQLDLARVRDAVEAAEHQTSAKIVVAIAPFFLGRVWPAARRAFDRLGVGQSDGGCGVLVFVVPARRKIAVLADDQAVTNVDASTWSEAVVRIVAAFAEGHGTTGLVEGIEWLARRLSERFPAA